MNLTPLMTWALSPDAIFVFAQKMWWFLIVLGVLVAFHEYGHFLAARWVGVKVLKFSIGFGPKLFSRTVGDTEYLVSAVPLGGYVKMFGEDDTEVVPVEEQRQSFTHQSLPNKTLIVAAGPGFNFLLTYLIFTGLLASGSPLFVPTFQDITPKVQAIIPDSPAAKAGLHVGDQILQANDNEISTYGELSDSIMNSHGRSMTIDVMRDGKRKTFLITPSVTPNPDNPDEPIYGLGIEAIPPLVGGVMPDTPAMKSGLLAGDRILTINEKSIHTWRQMTEIVRGSPDQLIQLDVQRGSDTHTLSITPAAEEFTNEDGEKEIVGKIGIRVQGRSTISPDSILTAPLDGMIATWKWCELTVIGVIKLLTGEISTKNIGGPVMIATVSGEHAEQGISSLIFLIAILSVNLGILNLLPIPVLDGGHLFFFACEAILGRPLGERSREVAQQVGLVLLLCIMVYATWNDVSRLLQ